MEDVKKWLATYTKHIKQKRKVYQDGVLELHYSNGSDKVLLYDDSGKVIGSKFVKKDEFVGSGETLTFDGYLVDIGDLDRSFGHLVDSNDRGKDVKSSIDVPDDNVELVNRPSVRYNIKQEKKDGSSAPLNRPNFRCNIQKESSDNNVAPKNRLSAKFTSKQEKENTGLGNNKSVETQPAVKDKIEREWLALYTSQKTQKAKKYHDGILRLVAGASSDRKQVFLYDDNRNQLDSRFLKKDEVVECGGALIFDGYLVDIGDLKESSKHSSDVKIQESSQRAMENTERLQVREKNGLGKDVVADDCPSVTNKIKTGRGDRGLGNSVEPENCQAEKSNREWDVLYTTQKTQKAKKYHDGILRLHVGAAQRRQVTLLDEDGTTLSSKYLNSSEDVRTGTRLVLASHLVEVGEARISQEGELQNDKESILVVPSFARGSNVDRIKSSTSGSNGPRNSTSSGNILCSDSGSSEKLKDSRNNIYNVSGIKDRVPDASVATENCLSIADKTNGEWNVLYTTQKTQKAKKYHEGILRIHVGVAHRRQATLLDEDGKILSTKYLNLSTENIKTGSKLELASHLVEICEVRIFQEGEIQDDKKSVLLAPSFSRGIINNSITNGKVLGSDSGSSSEKPKSKQGSIRDASQILLTLKKPTSEELCPVKEPVVQQSRGSFIDILEESPEDIMEISQSEDIHKPSCPSLDNGSKTENYSLTSVIGLGSWLQVSDFFLPDFSENTETPNIEVSGGNDAYPKSSNAFKRKANELSHENDFPSFDLGF